MRNTLENKAKLAEQLEDDIDALGTEILGRPVRVLSIFGTEAIDTSTIICRIQAILRKYGNADQVETVLEYYAAESRLHLEFRDAATGRKIHTFEDIIEKLAQHGALKSLENKPVLHNLPRCVRCSEEIVDEDLRVFADGRHICNRCWRDEAP